MKKWFISIKLFYWQNRREPLDHLASWVLVGCCCEGNRSKGDAVLLFGLSEKTKQPNVKITSNVISLETCKYAEA